MSTFNSAFLAPLPPPPDFLSFTDVQLGSHEKVGKHGSTQVHISFGLKLCKN